MNGDPFDRDTARIAALNRWAHEDDPAAATSPARQGFLARFERQVDPDGTLHPDERERRARRAMRAHMISIARKKKVKRSNLREVP